jgi:hypothetical protein
MFVTQDSSGRQHWGTIFSDNANNAEKAVKDWLEEGQWEPVMIKVQPVLTNVEFFVEQV